ncbi:RagB/SusD family nutrient uptake outer membrane protein [Sinomicrobium soli]|uniref:RagB/SusD family nutrient uptake outer membrane protein n=1 Tax=Sinomicrobium sp. N-1-3-6 TaxID=2219864 RepID=UPI000DCDEB76|nr:RagB/SusD family nutrient uptake outer membrane protein [Sinomicrobium sp. N-1-3-6]RAV31013.1 RagB/SusD family nutrient uptake outer membrane protein [Sinomicrobium sp. N-1-3-6]
MRVYNSIKTVRKQAVAVVSAIVLLLAAGCQSDFLDQVPDDIMTLEEVFSRKDLSESYLANVYNYLRDEAHRTNNTPWDVISDDIDVSQRNNPYRVNLGNWSAASDYWVFWDHYYKGIRSATTFLNHIDGNEQILEDREGEKIITQYKAEARFLRAFFYFELLKQYGPVIILDEELIDPDLSTEDPLMQQPRTPFDQCVDYITAELDLAAEDLPVHFNAQPEQDYGRATQLMCMAVKSRLLLYAASPLYNGNSDYNGFVNPDGTPLMNTSYDADKWKKAADAARDVINTGILSLYKEYDSNGDIDAFHSYQNLFLEPYNEEWILSRNSNSLSNYERSLTPRLANGYASMGATQMLVDTYHMANGERPILGYNGDGSPVINTASGYTETGFSEEAEGFTKAHTFNMYVNREPRFYASVIYSGSDWINRSSSLGVREIELWYNGESGKGGSHDYSETGYLFRKNVHPDSNPRESRYIARPHVMYRYAEILLNYAEALNEYEPGHPDILEYLNDIRERGGIPGYASGAGQEEMRNRIRRERRIELAMEHLRYFDTRRWKIAEQTDAGPFWGMDVNAGNYATDPAFFKRTVFENRVFRKAFYLFPIPQEEIERNPNLVQNPGW